MTQDWTIKLESHDFWDSIGKQDTAVFKNRPDKDICEHLDTCGSIMSSDKAGSTVVFRLPKMEVG